MGQRSPSYFQVDKFVFNMAALHSIAAPTRLLVSKSSVGSVPFLLCISFLVIGIFGSCFVVYGQGQRFASKLFQDGAKGAIVLLFVVVTGAISNILQNATFDAAGSEMLNLLMGALSEGSWFLSVYLLIRGWKNCLRRA